MKAIEITDIDEEVLIKYGVLYKMSDYGSKNTSYSEGDGWKGTYTNRPLIDSMGSLGYTYGTGVPFLCNEMERHLHSEEAQIPTDMPICFCMAEASDHSPKKKDIIPVILRPGYVFVLHRGTWHSSSHGLNGDCGYYWLCWTYYNEPTVWESIDEGPLQIE